jgi:hypothetical protein
MAKPAPNKNSPINFNTTNDNNISVVSSAIVEPQLQLERSVREIIDDDGVVTKFRANNITQNGFITLYGNYPQNQVDIPKFDLSSINVINDDEVTFNFILCLKDGETTEPKLYATSETFDNLQQNYNDSNPIPVNSLIHQRKIVIIDIAPLKTKVDELRIAELNLDINLSNVGDKEYVKVFKNLFVNSNFETNNVNGLVANPTYTIIEILRYISWVVSKPAQNYNNRILPADTLGQWGAFETEEPSETTPSTPVNQNVDTNNNPAPPPLPTYPPIGREGLYDEDTAFYNGKLYLWDADATQWFEDRADDRGN